MPRLLAMLCVLAVFIPAFFMTGAAKAMFVPLSLAVGFSMIASYLLSSTLVPDLIGLASAWARSSAQNDGPKALCHDFKSVMQRSSRRLSCAALAGSACLLAGCGASSLFFVGRELGTEIFPKVDAGQFKCACARRPARTSTGTEAIALQALDIIKNEVGADNVAITLGFVGVHAPSYPINLIYLWNGGSEEGVVQVQLKPALPRPHRGIEGAVARKSFAEQLPDVSFSFEPSDIVSRVMSLGASTPIEVAVSGPNLAANREFAEKVKDKLAKNSARCATCSLARRSIIRRSMST